MLRRRFIQSLAWLTGGLLVSCSKSLSVSGSGAKSIKGKVTAGGKGIGGVVVSDGFSVVQTSNNGKYEILLTPQSEHVFVSIPSGYAFPQEASIARHYKIVEEGIGELDFELQKLSVDDTKHQFIIWADPQVRNAGDVGKMMAQSVPDVQQFIRSQPASTLMHGISVGDIVWDTPNLFADYNKAVAQCGIPFFQVLGNHDMDYNKGGDEMSDDTFKKNYGPSYYSFNRGQVHYVVLDDVLYLGSDRNYKGSITQQQLDWLKKDLSFVPKDKLVVLCVHIPVHSSVDNKQALYDVIKEYNVHIMSGHTHNNRNSIRENVYEHVHGTLCGAWWTGPVCGDGTPPGFGVYEVDGNTLKWQYKSIGKPLDYQLSAQVYTNDQGRKEALANVWNWDKEWKVEWWADEAYKGTLTNTPGLDPQTVSLYKGDQLPKGRVFVEPMKTDHLFVAEVPNGASKIKFVATDRFGRTYQTIANV